MTHYGYAHDPHDESRDRHALEVENERLRAEVGRLKERAAPVGVEALTAMVDRAMVEMQNIHPPLRRSECERLIKAAFAVGAKPVAWRLVNPNGGTIAWYSDESAAGYEKDNYWPHSRIEPLFTVGTDVRAATPEQIEAAVISYITDDD